MTTGANDSTNITEDVEETEETEERDINKLLDLPYSEMTEEEIERVVEWKAQVKARDEQFEKTLEAIKEASEAQLKILQEQADKDAARADALLQASIERMNKANGD